MEFVHADGWRIVVLPARAPGRQEGPMFRLIRGFTWQSDMTERDLRLRLDGLGIVLGDMVPGRARPCLTLDRLSRRTCPNHAIETVGAAGATWSQICEHCLAVEAQVCPARSRPVLGPVLGTESARQRSERLREAMTKILGYAEILRDDQPVSDDARRRMHQVVHRTAGEVAGMMAETSWAL